MDIVTSRVETNLSAANIAYFARQFLKCDMQNINFHTAPVSGSYFGGVSYVSLNVNQWLEMLNEYLNPYDRDIIIENVDILVANYDGTYINATSGIIAGGPDSFVDLTGGKDDRVSLQRMGRTLFLFGNGAAAFILVVSLDPQNLCLLSAKYWMDEQTQCQGHEEHGFWLDS